jgi:hypothetical protein
VGSTVNHFQEPELGKGRVLALHRPTKLALVKWDSGLLRKHALELLRLAK